MATIKPFKALRPLPDKAKEVSCVPYDVVDEAEVRGMIERNPQSFLRVTRADGDFAAGQVPSLNEIFARAKENLERLTREGAYLVDDTEAIYVYQLSTTDQTQTGVVACCSLDEYEQGIIKKHEKTRPDKVEERTGHMLAVGAQTGLIFLTFRNTDKIRDLIADTIERVPLYDFYCPQNVRQRVWRVTETERWVKAFAKVPAIYIADGHHRAESALLARETMRAGNPDHTGREDYNYVVAGIFPSEYLRILPYNRAVLDLNGHDQESLFERIRESFILADSADKEPKHHGEFCMYFKSNWYKLRLKAGLDRSPDPVESLDVSILQNYLLGPVLGIDDPRTNARIKFVGGARGTEELERLVDSGEAKIAFSLYPTTMDDLLSVSDAGEIMPPKSTWFEPKLKDGLLVHLI